MRSAPRACFGSTLLVLCALGCDGDQPFEPDLEAARGGSGSLAAPSHTNAVAVSESQIDVSWQDNSDNESGFEVHRSTTGPDGTFTLRASTGAGVTGFSDAGLSHSTEYCYKVRAFRSSKVKTNYSAFSPTACATTPAPPIPAAPSDLFVIPEGSTVIYVGWSDNSTNEDGFRVERSTDAGASWTVAVTLAANNSAFSDTARTSEQEACYRVFAFNAGGDSPPSNTGCTTPPAAPTNLTATVVNGGVTVNLAWTDNSSVEDGYEVWEAYVDEWGNVGYTIHAGLPANTTEFQVGCCASYYLVRATKDPFGFSDFSNQAVPTTPAAASARAPAASTIRSLPTPAIAKSGRRRP